MEFITLEAKPRTPGKGPARAARRADQVPCVLYGAHEEPVVFQVEEKSLLPLIYTDEFHRVQVQIDGKSLDCILKEVDFHPVTDRPMHADFQLLKSGEKITVTVPIRYEGTPQGQRDGGRVEVFFHELEIRCLPIDIPDHLSIDVSKLEIGDNIHLSDLVTEDMEFSAGMGTLLYAVIAPRAEIEEEVAEEDLLEGELLEGEEGEEGEGEESDEEDED